MILGGVEVNYLSREIFKFSIETLSSKPLRRCQSVKIILIIRRHQYVLRFNESVVEERVSTTSLMNDAAFPAV